MGAEEVDAVCCSGDDVQVRDEEAGDVNIAPCTALETGLKRRLGEGPTNKALARKPTARAPE